MVEFDVTKSTKFRFSSYPRLNWYYVITFQTGIHTVTFHIIETAKKKVTCLNASFLFFSI